MVKNFLTIDNGGTNTKVIIFNQHGQQLAAEAFPTQGIEPQSGFHEIDLVKLRNDLAAAIRAVLVKANLTGKEIAGIATVGHGKGLYVLDNDYHIFMNGILSADSRAEEYAEEFEKRVSKIYSISRQHVMPSQAPVLLKWIKDNRPEEYEKIGAVLSNKDFVGFLLTGVVKQEIGDASGNNFLNLATQQYDAKLFDFFDIPEMFDKMPELIKATDLRGTITQAAAAQTNLQEGTPVFGGMFDIDACAIATGVLDDSKFSVIAGTWNMNIFPSDKTAPQESGLMNSIFPTGKNLIEASSPTSAGNLAIILKMLMTAEMRDAKDAGHSIYDDLEAFLENTDATFSKVLFFPFLYGSNAAPDAEGSFIGLRSNTTKSEMIRAVYEEIAFAHKYHIEALQKVSHKPEVIRMSGGACNSSSWVQMFANVLNVPVELVNATELGGLGGAIASAVGTGVYSSLEEASRSMSSVKRHYDPQPDQVKIYNAKYQAYLSFLKAMDSCWRDFKQLQDGLEYSL